MNVRTISHSHRVATASIPTPVASQQAATISVATPVVPANAPAAPQVAEIQINGDSEEKHDSAKGVIRLLEAGHFKGVADVRLRINFFDELSARSAQAARFAATEQVGQLVDSVTGQANELLQPLLTNNENKQTVADLLAQFEDAVNAAVADAASSTAFSGDALAGVLRSTFDSLVEQVTALVAPPAANEPAVAELPPVDSPVSPTVDDALASLRTAFEAALTTLLDFVSTASQQPPLSPPKGSGAAYDKFLSIYNSLLNPTSTTDERA